MAETVRERERERERETVEERRPVRIKTATLAG